MLSGIVLSANILNVFLPIGHYVVLLDVIMFNECCYAECRCDSIIMLNVVMLIGIVLGAVCVIF